MNLVESARYFKLSADQGNSHGQYQYAVCLLTGTGVDVDEDEAGRYFALYDGGTVYDSERN